MFGGGGAENGIENLGILFNGTTLAYQNPQQMPADKEYGARARILRILFAVLERPYGYTAQQLADRYNVSKDTIADDLRILANMGLVLDYDNRYRYALKVENHLRQLKDLLHFSEEDQALLYEAIDKLPIQTVRQQQLKSKLSSVYDFRRLGFAYLRKPHLTKVDQLLQAKEEKRQVILVEYRSSNSNAIADRCVEPFHVSPPDDTLQAYDADKKKLRHFRISRIKRITLTDTPWQFEGHHTIMRTDPFRIVDNNQVLVHLRLSVGAYNELLERYPLTKSYLEETDDPNIFDFQCMVNSQFYGLSNFILGFHHQIIEVVAPESLREHLREEIAKMKF